LGSTGFWRTATGRATFGRALGSTDPKGAVTRATSVAILAPGFSIHASDATGDAREDFVWSVPSLTGLGSTGFWRTATGGAIFGQASGDRC
jgi:hypothetical protein